MRESRLSAAATARSDAGLDTSRAGAEAEDGPDSRNFCQISRRISGATVWLRPRRTELATMARLWQDDVASEEN